MVRITKIKKAQKKIEMFLDGFHKHIFSVNELKSILDNKGYEWDLSISTTALKFITFLIEQSHLDKLEGFSYAERYTWRREQAHYLTYELALSLKPRSYLSHYTAMFLHGFTEQVPKTIYVTFERAENLYNREDELTQAGIDAAFQKDARKTNETYTYGEFRIVLINAYRNNHIGIQSIRMEDGTLLSIANKERTLIDSMVRPNYSGGLDEVCKAYKIANGMVQVNRLKAYLTNLKYTYPYQQSLGFLLDLAGFDTSKTDAIYKICAFQFHFYLDRQIKNPSYSDKWMIYYPDKIKLHS